MLVKCKLRTFLNTITKSQLLQSGFDFFSFILLFMQARKRLIGWGFYNALRVCLFEGEIGWMENFQEKIGEKMGLCVVWLGGEKETFVWGQAFSTQVHTKLFFPKWREKRGEKFEAYGGTKLPSLFIALTYPSRSLSHLLWSDHPYLSASSQQRWTQPLPCPHSIPHSIVLIYCVNLLPTLLLPSWEDKQLN